MNAFRSEAPASRTAQRDGIGAGTGPAHGTRFAFLGLVRHLDDAVHQRPRETRLRALPLALLVAAASALVGCSVDALDLEAGPASQNTCDDDDDCGDGRCVSGQCRADSGTITSLVLEVTPPADASNIAGVRFVRALANLNPSGGTLTDVDEDGEAIGLYLDHIARIDGTVRGQADSQPSRCVPPASDLTGIVAEDGSFPSRVTLTPRERLLGVQSPPHSKETGFQSETGNRFEMSVPTGAYDVYVEPLAAEGGCAVPPQLFLGASIDAGEVDLSLVLPAAQHLDVSVHWTGSTPALDGWTLDIVEQDSGRVLSTKAKLAEPEQVDDELHYQALVAYSPVEIVDPAMKGDAKSGTELVRLSPPEGVTAPVIIVQRSVVELFQKGEGVIDQLSPLPEPVEVTGQVSEASSLEGKSATVTLVATNLVGVGAGTVAAFQRVVEADSSGQFQVSLLPGTYSVTAVPPPETGLAAAQTEWEISADNDVQAGKLVQLLPSPFLSGTLLDTGGQAIAGVAVQAGANSASIFADVLDRALGRTPFVPRAEGTISDGGGYFQVRTDPGTFDIWARPEVGSGFAWFVRPSVTVGISGELDLGTLVAPLPVEYRGTMKSADTQTFVPSALIRAYAYVRSNEHTNDPSVATSLVQVAETRTNESGEFQLLLPASF